MRVTSRRGAVERAGADRSRAAAGPRVHDAALPRRGRHERADHRRDRPEVGHGRVQGAAIRVEKIAPQRARRREAGGARRGPRRGTMDHGRPSLDAVADRGRARGVDGVLGPPRSAGTAACGRSSDEGHVAHGGHDGAGPRHLLLPALHAVHERVGWISPGGSTTSASAYRAARRRVRRRDVLRAVLARAAPAAGRARLRRHRLRCNGSDELIAALERALGPRGRPRGDGRRPGCEPVPRAVRSRAGGAAHAWRARRPRSASSRPSRGRRARRARRRGRSRSARHATLPQAGGPGLRLLRRVGVVDPDEPRRLPRARRLRRAAPGGRDGPAGRHPRGHGLEARGPRRRRVPDGRKWEAVARQPASPALPGLQRRRVRARHVQGPRAHGGRPVRGDRGDDDRGLRDRAASRATSTCAASTRWPPSASSTPSPRRARAASSATTSWARASRSTSRSARAPGPTSAARRRRSSTRSRASAASRATSRRSRSSRALFGKPTVVNNVETLVNVLGVILLGGPAFAEIGHRGLDRHEALLRLRPRRAARRLRGAVRDDARELLDLAGGVRRPEPPDGAARRRGRQVRAPGRARSAAHVRGTRGRRRRPSARASSWSSTRPSTCRACSGGSRPSSATSRAASACRAASGRCARRRRWRGSRADRHAAAVDAELALIAEMGRACATRRSAASGRPRRARRVGDRPPCGSSTGTGGTVMDGQLAPRRMVELEIDGRAVRVSEGSTILDACEQLGIDTPDALLRGDAPPGERVPGLRGRGRGRARVWSPPARGRSSRRWSSRRIRSACGTAGAWCSSSSAPRSISRDAAPPTTWSATQRTPRYGPPAPPDPLRDRKRTGHHVRAGRPDRGHGPRTGQGRQRALRARLLEVHPLLQVRRRLRRAVPEHVRDRRRGPRLRRADLDRVRRRSCPSPPASTAATASRSARPAR